jgi:hypothetical protein
MNGREITIRPGRAGANAPRPLAMSCRAERRRRYEYLEIHGSTPETDGSPALEARSVARGALKVILQLGFSDGARERHA